MGYFGLVFDKGQSVWGSLPISRVVPGGRLAGRGVCAWHCGPAGELCCYAYPIDRHMLSNLGQRLAVSGVCLVAVAAAAAAGPSSAGPSRGWSARKRRRRIGECVPTEKDKSTLPPYTVEPPDILLIEAVRVVPKPPYHIQAGDVLQIESTSRRKPTSAARGYLRRSRRHASTWARATARCQVGGLTDRRSHRGACARPWPRP